MSHPRERASAFAPIAQGLVAAAAYVLAFTVSFELSVVGCIALAVWWPPDVGWRPLPAKRVLQLYLPFALVWLAIAVGYLYLMRAVGAPVAPQPMLDQLAGDGIANSRSLAIVVGAVVIAPIWEEIVFRGYLFAALDRLLPPLPTQLLTAAVFGLVHGLEYAFPIGVLALFFGWLRARYDALLPSILAHAVHNGLSVTLVLCWPGHLDLLYPQ